MSFELFSLQIEQLSESPQIRKRAHTAQGIKECSIKNGIEFPAHILLKARCFLFPCYAPQYQEQNTSGKQDRLKGRAQGAQKIILQQNQHIESSSIYSISDRSGLSIGTTDSLMSECV